MSRCSEFEELEAVPTMAVMDGPLEPSSSTTSSVIDVSDDPSFVNFFSVCTLLNYMTSTHEFHFGFIFKSFRSTQCQGSFALDPSINTLLVHNYASRDGVIFFFFWLASSNAIESS